jgi:hypothetical protein
MTSPASTPFTEAEYLALERASDRKREFLDGLIVAMAGARPPQHFGSERDGGARDTRPQARLRDDDQ